MGKSSVAEDLRATFIDARSVKTEENQLKQRLAQLRQDRAAEADEEVPIVDETTADEVLGDDSGEAAFKTPFGFKVAPVPLPAQLDTAQKASQQLVGKKLGYLWPGLGWVIGTIKSTNTDRRFKTCVNVMNFIVKFDQDDEGTTTRVFLTADAYGVHESVDAWVIFVGDVGGEA